MESSHRGWQQRKARSVLIKASVALAGLGIGYALGTRAGRQRYEDLVAIARRVTGSQTIQATAGVVQAQVDEATVRLRERLASKLPNRGYATHAHGRINGSV